MNKKILKAIFVFTILMILTIIGYSLYHYFDTEKENSGFIINKLNIQYFDLNNINAPIEKSTISSLNFSFQGLTPSSIKSNYLIKISGYIKPKYTEEYIFTIPVIKDSAELTINNILIMNVDKMSIIDNSKSLPIKLNSNEWIPFELTHTINNDNEQIQILWSSKSQKSTLIPFNRLAISN